MFFLWNLARDGLINGHFRELAERHERLDFAGILLDRNRGIGREKQAESGEEHNRERNGFEHGNLVLRR